MPPAAGFHHVSRLHEDEKHHLQVSCARPPLSSTQRKFKSFLLSLENLHWMLISGCLTQFWTPMPSRGKRKRLSISEQPFGLGKVCYGVCRYWYHCIQCANGIKDIGETDPICKSFTWDSPEFSQNIDNYSTEEFPLKHCAKDCGFQCYLALPIFEQRNDRQSQQRGSAGVLGILTFTENISLDATFLEKLKGFGVAIRCPPPCKKPEGCRGRFDMRVVGLYPLRDPCNLPLIQKWLDGHSYFVEDGKSWVGRVHLQSPSSTTLFHCLMCNPFQQLRKYYVEFGLTDDEEFSVELSHRDDVYNVHRSAGRTGCQELGNGNGKDHKVATVQGDTVQHYQIKNGQLGEASKAAKRPRGDQVQSHELGCQKEDHEVATVLKDNVQHYQIKNGQFGEEASKATKRLKDDQVQSHEASECHGEKQLLSLSVQQPNSETAAEKKKTQSFLSSVQQPSSETTDDKKNPQGTTDAPGEPGSNIRKRKITLAMIENYFDRRLEVAAAELKVSKSTLKRYCRKYGIKSWPSPKRNKANPVLRPSNELGDCGGKEQECDSRPSPDHNSREKQVTDANRPGNYNFDLNHSFIVKARYNEFIVKFPFSTHSGIDALYKSLAMRFKLEAEMIRIEYEDEDGDRVMISCDEDLSYHMHTLSSSGRTQMDLSVLPAV